jgi:hypothetical protein
MVAQFDAGLWYTDVLESSNVLVHIRKTCLSRLLFLIEHQYLSAPRTDTRRTRNQKRLNCGFKRDSGGPLHCQVEHHV